jgi:hypothetical protein
MRQGNPNFAHHPIVRDGGLLIESICIACGQTKIAVAGHTSIERMGKQPQLRH